MVIGLLSEGIFMRLIKVLAATVLLVMSQLSFADPSARLEYITEDFPPYNFKGDDGDAHGLNVDLLVEMFKEMGASKGRPDIKIQPWARGYRAAQEKGKINVLFSTTRTEARESLFKWVGPLSEATNALITLKGNPHNVVINSDADFANYKYGAIRDDIGELKLKEAGVTSKQITHGANFPALVKMLNAKRVQAISYNATVGLWLIKQAGFNPDDFEIVYSKTIGEHYFAFNKSVDDATVAAHQEALDKVKANASLVNSIKDKYLK